MNTDEKAISAALTKYEDALNRSDTDAVMKLYAPDGVFMPQNFPSSLGADAVRKAYDGVFRTITLSVKFAVAEIKQVGSRLGICAHEFGWDGQGQCNGPKQPRGQPRTIRLSKGRPRLEDRSLLFFDHQPAAWPKLKTGDSPWP